MKSEQDYNTSFAIGVLLLENKGLVFGKTLEIDGWYASGKLRIPLGRYIMIFIKLIYYFHLFNQINLKVGLLLKYLIYYLVRWHVSMFVSFAITDKDEAMNFWCDGGWKFRKTKTSFQKRFYKSNRIFQESVLQQLLHQLRNEPEYIEHC